MKNFKTLCQKLVYLAVFMFFSCILISLPVQAEETDTTLTTPTNVTVTLEKDNWNYDMAHLTWDGSNPSDDSNYEYEIQISCNKDWASMTEDDWYYVDTYSSTETSLYYDWIFRGDNYYFRVRSVYYDEETSEFIYSSWSKSAILQYYYNAPANISIKSAGTSKITLSWSKVDGAGGYRIYRSTSKNGTYSLIKTITDPATVTYTNFKNLKTGTTYYYKICTYNADFANTDGFKSKIYSAAPLPVKRTLTAKPASYSSITLSWNKDSSVDGYIIYRSDSQSGTYKKIKTITSSNTATYKNAKLTIGKSYYYKIRSYVTKDGKTYYSPYSSSVKGVASVLAPTLQSAKIAAVTKATLTWTKVSGAHGYAIYKATSKNGTYKRIATIKSGSTLSYTVTGLSNGKTYYFKIKAYRTVNGKNYYGPCSSIKSRLMNKLGYAGESYESRCKRIFKTTYYKDFTSSSQASAQMKTISVKVWDINSSGKKYTKTLRVTVHKNIASTVQQIFKEIYNGKEKFPIHSIGGYSWRGNSSSSEHCEGLAIDINANENAMINKTTGKILSGSFYKPGVNPYSIPANGDVVKAFEKYGFYWGDWSTKADYMHFSYFGT